MQLRDGTGAVACVLTESDQTGQQSAVFNTAWIGTAPRCQIQWLKHSEWKFNCTCVVLNKIKSMPVALLTASSVVDSPARGIINYYQKELNVNEQKLIKIH